MEMDASAADDDDVTSQMTSRDVSRRDPEVRLIASLISISDDASKPAGRRHRGRHFNY